MDSYIKRCFYPVGQGGFAAEFFDDFTMVYDCGTKSVLGKEQEEGIWDKFDKACNRRCSHNGTVDVLFISHFDEDHVSMLDYLFRHFNVKKVFMPFLFPNMVSLLKTIYPEDSISYKLVTGEFNFEDAKTYQVLPYDCTADTTLSNIINSGIPIDSDMKKNCFWQYIPFLSKPELGEKFRNECLKKGVDPILLDDELYNSDKTAHNIGDIILKYKDILREIYQNLPQGINQNSLMVFSRYSKETEHLNKCFCIKYAENKLVDSINCVYTGDEKGYNVYKGLNKLSEAGFIKEKSIGMIQIPHHGSIHNRSMRLLKYNFHTAVVQYGTPNQYKHPNSIILDDFANHKYKLYEGNNVIEKPTEVIKVTNAALDDEKYDSPGIELDSVIENL